MLDMLEPGWGDTWGSHAGLVPNISQSSEGCDFSGACPALERRTTVKDLLKMKRQIQGGMLLKQRQLRQTPEHMDVPVHTASTQNYGRFDLGHQAEETPAPSHHSPEHTVSSGQPSFAPGTPSPPHMDLSPTYVLTDPPTAYLNFPSHLQFTPSQQQPAGAEAPITTLFQWQIKQQLNRMKDLSPELFNMQDSDGDTPLHIAVAQGKRALAYVLAANMALSGTLDLPEHNGQTALHIAAATDQSLMVCDLVEYGAQVHMRDTWGRSPLHVCVEKGHVRSLVSMFRSLKATGKDFDVDLVNYNGLTSLHVAVLAHNATLRELSALGKSCSVNKRESLLKKERAFLECVKALLQMGASCGAKDQKSGRTSLHMAAEEANTQLLEMFLNQPTTLNLINLRTFSGNTALHIVCALPNRRAQLQAVQMLMRRGADPGARNYENELPCQLLSEGGSAERVQQVLKGRHFHQ